MRKEWNIPDFTRTADTKSRAWGYGTHEYKDMLINCLNSARR